MEFDIHNPNIDSISDICQEAAKLALDNPGRQVIKSLGVLDTKTAGMYHEYLISLNSVFKRLTAETDVSAMVTKVHYYQEPDGYENGNGGWVDEIVLKVIKRKPGYGKR